MSTSGCRSILRYTSVRERPNGRFCKYCNKPLVYRQRKFCSTSCRSQYTWHNDEEYDSSATQPEYRRKAIEAYGYECSGCGCTEGCLMVHHLDGNHYNDDLSNLVVLCTSCHTKIHSGGAHIIDKAMTEYVIRRRDSQ